MDWEKYEGIHLVKDIGALELQDIPFVPDLIWASPDCATYSVTRIYTHRDGIKPKTDYAAKCDAVNAHFIGLIKQFLIINPQLMFYIENPRGMFRCMPFIKGIDRTTVWYCKYGDFRAKPTDIFSNNIINLFNLDGWNPRPECRNNSPSCHHEKSPRGINAGTAALKNSFERSKIPMQLMDEILTASEKKYEKSNL